MKDTLTRAEALAVFSAQGETRCDVFCLPDAVLVGVGDRFLDYDALCAMETDGLIHVRLEQVPHAPMGPRTPPIRWCSLTEFGRAAVG